MIFKTIGKNSIFKTPKIFNSSLKEIKKTFQSGGITGIKDQYFSKLSKDDILKIKEYNSLITAYDQEQPNGASAQTAWRRTVSNASPTAQRLVEKNKGEAVPEELLVQTPQRSAFPAKLAATAGNMLAIAGISEAISRLVTWINSYVTASERAKEASDTLMNKISEFHLSVASNSKTLQELNQRYQELSGGVNKLGENISLPTSEYEEYKNIINQIHEIMPDLSVNFNAQGEAVAFTAENITDLTKKYEEYQKQAARTFLSEGDGEGNTISSIIDNYNNQENRPWYDNLWEKIKKPNGLINTIGLANVPIIKDITSFFGIDASSEDILESNGFSNKNKKEFYESIQNLTPKQIGKISNYTNILGYDIDDISKMNDTEFQEFQQIIQQEIDKYDNLIESSANGMKQIIVEKLGSKDSYYNLSDDARNNVLSIVTGLNDDLLQELDIDNELKAGNFADSLIKKFSTNTQFASSFNQMFDKDLDNLPVKNYVNKINRLSKTIANELNLSDDGRNILLENLGFGDLETLENLYNETIHSSTKQLNLNGSQVNDLETFFEEHSINTEEEIQSWNEILKIVNNVEEAKKRYVALNTDPVISFDEAWNNTTTESKEALLELAEAGKLTAEELEKSPAGKTIMEQTKLSAEEAAESVNKLVDKSSQLSNMKSGIQSISNVLAQKQEYQKNPETQDTGIDSSTLSGFDASIKGLDSWKQFEKTLGNGKSSMEDCQQAANKLATEWVNSNNFLSQLDDTNEEYYISQLKEMGVENARSIVSDLLNQKKAEEAQKEREIALEKEYNKQSSIDLTQADRNQIDALGNYVGWTEETRKALYRLALQKQIANGIHLNTQDDIDQLISLVEATGGTTKALKKWKNYDGSGGTNKAKELWQAAMDEATNPSNTEDPKKTKTKNKNKNKNKNKTVKISPASPKSPSETPNTNPKAKAKQSFDWLDRYVTVLTHKIDLLKAKLENLFSVEAKNNNLTKQIKIVNKEIKAYSKEVSIYTKKANAFAAKRNSRGKRNISKDLQKQIDNGKFKGKTYEQLVKEYNEGAASKIQKYMDLKDKAATAKQNRTQAKKSKRELKIQKRQNWVDYYDSLGSQYDAQIEIAATAKVKNDLEKDKLKYVEKSYNQQIKIAKLEQDSVKASTLLAQKWKEIADSRERILQNQLDENAAKRDYNNAAYENADNAGKKSLAQANIAEYNKDDQAYAENVKSAQKNVDTANGNISQTAKSASKRLKKESIDSKIVKEINGYLNSGKKVPDKYMKMAEYTYPKLYQKLLAYNDSIDAAEIAKNALAKAQENQQKTAEENQTAKREERSKIIQLDIDAATNSKDLLSAQYNNLSSAKEKNNNIDAQLQQQQIIHNKTMDQIKNDITDPTERETALEKEKAEWITTQREQSVLKLQNLADEESAQYTLKQQMEANADTAEEKNKYEAESLEHLKSQYDLQMQIAKENGDQTEQDRLRLELEQKIEESYQRQIANIREEYELMIGMNDARKSTIDAQIAALQANGYGASKELLQQQMALEEDSYQKTLEEIERISEKIPTLSGDARIEAEKDLEAEKQKAWGFQQNLGELQQTINDIDLAKIERIGTALEYYGNNLDYIQDILSHSDFTLSDSEIGGLTTEGLASTAVTFAQIANNQEQIANIYDQIAEKRRQLADTNLENGDPLTEEIDTLIQKAHDLEKANYDYGESIKTMVIDSLNSLSDALDENISKHKEALQAKKDLYDYNQKIAKQLKSISSLEKQLAALQGSDTEEAQARIQKLQIQLEDEQQNLKDMEYEKYIQDQEELLDKVSDDFQDFIASVADSNVSDICATMSNIVSDNLPAIGTAIEDAFEESSKIGELATGISGLSEMIEKLNFSGNVSTGVDKDGNIHYGYTDDNGNKADITVDNNDKPNTITALTVNGENIPLPEKEVINTEDDINNAVTKGTQKWANEQHIKEEAKKALQSYIERRQNLRKQVNDLINSFAGYTTYGCFASSTNSLIQDLSTYFGKMPSQEQETELMNMLGETDTFRAREKLRALIGYAEPTSNFICSFSHGGIATHLNKIALANGDDGWATLKRGESVLTPAQTEQFQRLTENLVPLNTIAESVTSLPSNPAPVNHSPASTTTIRNMDIHLDGSHVMDTDTFIQTLHNPRVLQEVSSGVSSQLGNVLSNKLGRF